MINAITNIMVLNLQLFAYDGNATTDGGMTVEMKTFYDRKLLREAGPNLVHMQFGQKRPIPKNNGKKIEFRKFDPLPKSTTPITEGVTPTGKKMNATNLEAEVHQYGDYIAMTDMLKLTTYDPIMIEATMMIGKQAGLSMDTIVRDIINNGTNVNYCSKIGVGGTETPCSSREELDKTAQLTVKEVDKAATKLKQKNAPTMSDGYYVGIIHPYAAFDLRQDKRWEEWNKYTSPEHMYKGEIGRIAGVRFVETSEAKVFSGNVLSTLILGQNAYGVTDIEGGGLRTIVKQLGSAGSADPLDQRATVGWKAILTAAILVDAYMVRVESMSSTYTTIAAN